MSAGAGRQFPARHGDTHGPGRSDELPWVAEIHMSGTALPTAGRTNTGALFGLRDVSSGSIGTVYSNQSGTAWEEYPAPTAAGTASSSDWTYLGKTSLQDVTSGTFSSIPQTYSHLVAIVSAAAFEISDGGTGYLTVTTADPITGYAYKSFTDFALTDSNTAGTATSIKIPYLQADSPSNAPNHSNVVFWFPWYSDAGVGATAHDRDRSVFWHGISKLDTVSLVRLDGCGVPVGSYPITAITFAFDNACTHNPQCAINWYGVTGALPP